MEISHLETFLKVVESGSFTQAARDLGLSQPAISQQMAKLEETLRQPLFERQGRTIKLTHAGDTLKTRAEQILAMVRDARREVTDDGVAGRLVLGGIPTVAPFILPPLIARFHKLYPKVQIEIREDVTERLLRLCQQGEVDAALLALPVDESGLKVEPLFDEPLLLALPAKHRLASFDRIRPADLEDESFILLGEEHCLRGDIVRYCQRHSFQPVSVNQAQQLATVEQLVASGFGVSFIPEMAVGVTAAKSVVHRPLATNGPKRRIAVCWNPVRYQTRVMRAFFQELRQYTSERGKS
jgi:LysR family hydrogen peroxide-inducible transcriptional activator